MINHSNIYFLFDLLWCQKKIHKIMQQKKLVFTPCKAEKPLQGMELQVKGAQKDYSIQEIFLQRTYS